MVDYSWPEREARRHIGKRIDRLDGPVKATGHAKYSYDIQRPGMLYGKLLVCPHAHAKITRLDVSRAQAMSGVKAVRVIQDVGTEIQWAFDEIVAVAAISEEIARDAVRAVEVEYEVLSHFVEEARLEDAPETKPAQEQVTGDPDAAFASAPVVIEASPGLPQMAHCPLEAHGQVAEWEGDELTVYASTQGVSTLPFQFAESLGVPASSVRIRTDYMGGGFGSKFSPDRWGIEGARLARDAGAPVKLFLERDQEVTVAGSRPSAFAHIRLAADREGNLLAWESESWGSGGVPGSGMPPIPYVFEVPNQRKRHISVPTNLAGSRAWRAPNHPQACFLTMTVLEDLAAKLGMDPLELFRKNLPLVGERAPVYEQELAIAAEKIGWAENWHPRGESGKGPRKRGLGLSLHTWGGRGHRSNCEVTVHPDGAVEAKLGTQDLGTGTRTVVAIVLAETFGLALDQVTVQIGDSRLPMSSPSGGSTTVGGVSAATRRAAQDALAEILAKVAPELGVEPEDLEAVDGRVRLRGEPDKSLSWLEATRLIGMSPITATGRNPGRGELISSGVGGVQMADVTVDVETGLVSINRMVAVQDCGLIIDLETAESQVFGALIMGIGYALFEEWVADPVSGRVLNPNMEFYRLAGFGDVGELEVHMMSGPGFDERGVIGLGEPPVISPGAAISNAVANAIGVRVPHLPLTPDRVLAALAEASQEVA